MDCSIFSDRAVLLTMSKSPYESNKKNAVQDWSRDTYRYLHRQGDASVQTCSIIVGMDGLKPTNGLGRNSKTPAAYPFSCLSSPYRTAFRNGAP